METNRAPIGCRSGLSRPDTHDQTHAVLSDPVIGPLWSEAKRLSDKHNPVAEYINPSVAAGGLDFSDTVEITYILGFDEMENVSDFVNRFTTR